MQHQCVGLGTPSGAERARNGGSDRAAKGAGRHHLHQHHHRKDQRHPCERIGSEFADEVGFDQTHGSLGQHDQDVGRTEPKQGRHNRRFQEEPGAGIQWPAV